MITRQSILDTDIYCLTAEKFSRGRSNIEVVRAMLNNGIRLVQYREKEKKMGPKYAECLEIRRMTQEAGAAFVVNDDIDLAIAVQADGVHIGQDDLPLEVVRRLVGEDMAIGLSTHSPEEAQAAVRRGADYIGVGPIFRTFTKEDVCDPVGFEYLEYVARNVDIPFVAIGGIKRHNVADVVRRGAHCVALITEIVEADDIGTAIGELREAMQSAKE
jgi:thiamine-phosphate pyrophosphorylase